MLGARGGYTLIELTVTTVLLAVVVGVSTLAVPGMTSEQRLRTAAARIAAAYRVAAAEAGRSSRPYVLILDGNQCTIQRPAFREDAWQWDDHVSFTLSERIRIVATTEPLASQSPGRVHKPLRIPVWTAGGAMGFEVDLTTGSSARARVAVSRFGSRVEMRPITE